MTQAEGDDPRGDGLPDSGALTHFGRDPLGRSTEVTDVTPFGHDLFRWGLLQNLWAGRRAWPPRSFWIRSSPACGVRSALIRAVASRASEAC